MPEITYAHLKTVCFIPKRIFKWRVRHWDPKCWLFLIVLNASSGHLQKYHVTAQHKFLAPSQKGSAGALCIWVASVSLTTNLTPSSGLELVFTNVLIWNRLVPCMTRLQAPKFLAPFHWWFTCKLAGNGIKRLRLGAEASKQLILKSRLWVTYSSRGRPGRMAIFSRCSGESRWEIIREKKLAEQLDP